MKLPIRIMLVDDHAIVREGLRTLLSEENDILVIGEAATGEEAVRVAHTLQPDVILMDLLMTPLNGIDATRQIRSHQPNCQILVLTSFGEDQRVHEAIQAGAIGFLLKDVLKADLLRAIQAAARGEPTLHPVAQRALMRQSRNPTTTPFNDLTERELDVLRLIAQGKSNRDIAQTLFLTEGTVKGYVSTILSKLALDDRTQAALFAVKHGLVSNG